MVSTANDYYGHKVTLARYAGVPPAPMLGYLQHGWAMWRPFPPEYGSWVGGVPKLVWSTRDADWCRDEGLTPVHAVGAPFLYQLAMTGGAAKPEPGSLVAYPYHSHSWADVCGDWDGYAADLATLGYRSVTVCLHPFDFGLEHRREPFERRGMQVVTNGDRSDPLFLERALALVERHEAATTNRVSTAIFYAAKLGRRVFLRGPLMLVAREKDPEGFDDARVWNEVHGQHFPELLEGVEGSAATAVGDRELGTEHMLSPDDLRRVLGWSGARRLAARGLSAVTAARRRLLNVE